MRISDWSSDVCSSELGAECPPCQVGPPVLQKDESTHLIGDGAFRLAIAGLGEAGQSMVERQAVPLHESGEIVRLDRKSVGQGKSVSDRVDLGGRRVLNKHKSVQLVLQLVSTTY